MNGSGLVDGEFLCGENRAEIADEGCAQPEVVAEVDARDLLGSQAGGSRAGRTRAPPPLASQASGQSLSRSTGTPLSVSQSD